MTVSSANTMRRWDYQPNGPFYAYRLGQWFMQDMTLTEAVALFAADALPTDDREIAAVMDDNDIVVLGYISSGGKTMWWGLEAGFDALEALGEVDPINTVLWRIEAKANLDGLNHHGHV